MLGRIHCYLLNDLCQGWHWGLRIHRAKNRQNSYSIPVRGDNNATECIEWSWIEGGALTEGGYGLSSWGDDRGIERGTPCLDLGKRPSTARKCALFKEQ